MMALAKRKAGAPLSEAERKQRSEAAKARWSDAATAAGAVAAGGLALAGGAYAVKEGGRAVNSIGYARRLHRKQKEFGQDVNPDKKLITMDEKVVYRGAPQKETVADLKRRGYNAVYFAQEPDISRGYMGSGPDASIASWAMPKSKKLLYTGEGAEDTPIGRKLAEAQYRGDRKGGKFPVFGQPISVNFAVKPSKVREAAKQALNDKYARQGELYSSHVAPSKLAERYLRRHGYHGTQGQSGNIALFDTSGMRRLRDVPKVAPGGPPPTLMGIPITGLFGRSSYRDTSSRRYARMASKVLRFVGARKSDDGLALAKGIIL